MHHGAKQRLVLVTGPSGAGRSTAIHALEDLGFEAIDNMPLSLLAPLLEGKALGRPLALGFDTRNRDFTSHTLVEMIDGLAERGDLDVQLLYLDCRGDTLLRRYSETRRRHPLAPGETPADGIARDFDLLEKVKSRADVMIDTSELSPHDLRSELAAKFAVEGAGALAVTIQSFSYKHGIPHGLDMVFDVRFLRNPYWDVTLRPFDGRDEVVRSFIKADVRFETFFSNVMQLVLHLLPAYVEEGKTHLTIGFGCTGGQHRSVAMTELMADALAQEGWQVSKRHRGLARRGVAPALHDQGTTA
ncbi:RNase adapter RapZ [Brevirhabdus sp.]|uniref:RNase adapter RapZ n=1 Tax=Brevirhabdus sp. TaxID=2004514 RepID=UPI0040598942